MHIWKNIRLFKWIVSYFIKYLFNVFKTLTKILDKMIWGEGGGGGGLDYSKEVIWIFILRELYQLISAHCCASCRNQSFDLRTGLQSKSSVWFLYEIQHWADMGWSISGQCNLFYTSWNLRFSDIIRGNKKGTLIWN